MEVITRDEARERGLKRFFTGIACKHGHVAHRLVSTGSCVECNRLAQLSARSSNPEKFKEMHRDRRAANPEKYRAMDKARREADPEKHRAMARERYALDSDRMRLNARARSQSNIERYRSLDRAKYANHPEKYRAKGRLYYSENTEKVREARRVGYAKNIEERRAGARVQMRALRAANRDEYNAKQKSRYASDEFFAFSQRARRLCRAALERVGLRKAKRTEELLGCTLPEFRAHLERQFLPGMSWSNRGEWHIDHIVPISSAKTLAEAESLCHVSNLRPIWAIDNLSKSAKRIFLL